MTTAKTTVIIPARGGSKGIPRKNIAPLYGKPMLAWSIEEALKSDETDRVIVSTDSDEIASITKQYDAEVIMRPEEISGDFATSESVLLHALYSLSEQGEEFPETTVFLHCSTPLTLAEDIDGTVRAMKRAEADSALAVVPFYGYFWKTDETTGEVIPDGHEKGEHLRRQERTPKYLEAGAVYVMNTEAFLQNKKRLFGQVAMYEMPAERYYDIDTPTDLTVAEVLIANQVKNGQR